MKKAGVNMAKNKVKVEYDVDMEKERRKKQQKNGKPGFAIRRSNILLYGLLLVVEVLFYYFLTPAINVHTSGFWTWVILTLAAIGFCSFDFKGTRITKKGNIKEAVGSTKVVMVSFTAILVLIVGLIIGGLVSSKLFRASKYAGIIKVEDGDFATDVPESENINNIALMDTDSARIIGDRAIGSLSDVVSQYQVSETYSTIDYNGVPMKVAPLEYAGFIKYLNNKDAGIPGYVLVDPVKNEADYVKLEKPIQYSSSAYFGKNLQRHYLLALFQVLLLQLLHICLFLLFDILYAINVMVLLQIQLLHLIMMYDKMDTSLSFLFLYILVLFYINLQIVLIQLVIILHPL